MLQDIHREQSFFFFKFVPAVLGSLIDACYFDQLPIVTGITRFSVFYNVFSLIMGSKTSDMWFLVSESAYKKLDTGFQFLPHC